MAIPLVRREKQQEAEMAPPRRVAAKKPPDFVANLGHRLAMPCGSRLARRLFDSQRSDQMMISRPPS